MITLIAAGNPVDGFSFHGPFADEETAQEFAENSLARDWWTAELESPVHPGLSVAQERDDLRAVLRELVKAITSECACSPMCLETAEREKLWEKAKRLSE